MAEVKKGEKEVFVPNVLSALSATLFYTGTAGYSLSRSYDDIT